MAATERSVSPLARGLTPRGIKTPTRVESAQRSLKLPLLYSLLGKKILSYQLSETVLNAMAIIGMIGQIDDSRTMIDALMSRSGGRCQFMIGWGGRLSVHDRLGERIGYFPRNQEELEEMANAWDPMNLFSTGMLILIGWNQGRYVINQYGRHSFPSGVRKG